MDFLKLDLKNQPLNLKYTLFCGQAFRWKDLGNSTYIGIIKNNLIILKQNENKEFFWTNMSDNKDTDLKSDFITEYFRTEDNINSIYTHLIEADKTLEPIIEKFYGLRILKQDLHETIFSFLCSSANSIPKITEGINKLSYLFKNNYIGNYKNENFYSFPSLDDLSISDSSDLRAIKELAFRGKNIYEVANTHHFNKDFYEILKKSSYEDTHKLLSSTKNIGYKIADCICLFALGFDHVVPIDTHVRQIAINKFSYKILSKTISKTTYRNIQKIFLEKYGQYAGWAQQFLFMNEISK